MKKHAKVKIKYFLSLFVCSMSFALMISGGIAHSYDTAPTQPPRPPSRPLIEVANLPGDIAPTLQGLALLRIK